MADNLNSGNILTQQIGGNVVSIDPNRLVAPDGKITDRLVNHEDLVMYANLTAMIIPRSKLLIGAAAGDEIRIEIADGELNFLKPKGKTSFDSDWTEAFTNPDVNKQIKTTTKEGVTISKEIKNQNDFQGFGITSISIKINSSYIPQVTINFTDVRGKTLFEQARVNTPYTAFFHLPYPTFFLTIKGFYGKAVQYQLTMEKFVARFDPSSGDYLVTCDFKGNHIAMLRDINMHEIVTAPYMYPTRTDADSGDITMTKGRQYLEEVYGEYYSKKLIGDDIFDKKYTVVELIEKIQAIDNDMSNVFGKAPMEATTHKLEYAETLKKFREAVTGNKGWAGKYLDTRTVMRRNLTVIEPPIPSPGIPGSGSGVNTGRTITTAAYPLKGMSAATMETDPTKKLANKKRIVDSAKNALAVIVNKYKKLLSENPTFNSRSKEMDGKYRVQTKFNDNTYDIYESSKVEGMQKIDGITASLKQSLAPWFAFEGKPESFMTEWLTTKNIFNDKAKTLAEDLSVILNTRLMAEIGFKPTIRNVFAIILAGADTFLRLLDDVHTDAFAQRQNPQRLAVAIDSNDTAPTTAKANQIVYPWPQYYNVEEQPKGEGGCSVTSSVLTYPGASNVIATTLANDSTIWPEVKFVEEYTKTTNYKYASFTPPINNEGINKDFTPITVYDWTPTLTPYDSMEDLDVWYEILDRAQIAVLRGGLMTRYQGITNTALGQAITELAKYDALNLYQRLKPFAARKQVFLDLGGMAEMLGILSEADYGRFFTYQQYGTITPFNNRPTYDINFKPNPFTVRAQQFEENTRALQIGKTNSLYDLAPTIFGPWVSLNFANGETLTQNDFYDISKNLMYDINDKNVLADVWTTTYLTDGKYSSSLFIDEDQELLIERKNNSNALNTVGTVDEAYASYSENKFLTEGDIIFNSQVTVIPGGGTNTQATPLRLTSMLNTPYFINSLIMGVDAEKNSLNSNPYTHAAYLLLNSLPLPTFREKALGKISNETEVSEDVEFGNYLSQIFNQMPAVHKVPTSLLLRIGSVWWRYKNEVQTTVDPLDAIWGNLGKVSTLSWSSPKDVYDDVTNNINITYNLVENGTSYAYNAELATPRVMQVGVYPALIDTLHYIVTGNDSYTNGGAGFTLNDLIGGPGMAPLTITQNSSIGYTSTDDNTEVKFYNVFLDSANITNTAVGVTNVNQPSIGHYYVLYPSSGGLNQTDASTYDNPTFMNPALHNGAARILWGASNYGYFEHNASYQSTAWEYFKKIDPTQDKQEAWQFKADSDYSTIQVLRAVFNTEQLDAFEQQFLTFSTPLGDSNLGGSLKELVKELCVVEQDWIDMVATNITSAPISSKILAEAQLIKFNTSMFHFLNKKVEYIHRTTTNIDLVIGGAPLLERLNFIHSINHGEGVSVANLTDLYGSYTSGVQIPTAGNVFVGNPVEYQAVRINIGEYYAGEGDPQFQNLVPQDITNPIYNFFTTLTPNGLPDGIQFDVTNITLFAPFIRLYASYCTLNTPITAAEFLNILMADIDGLQNTQELYIGNLLEETQKLIKKHIEDDDTTVKVNPVDERPEVTGDDLKLELYTQFKVLNDRWIAGTNVMNNTLFEKFVFLDRGNQDIGDEAIINIWDILLLDSPFSETNSKTLTQSVASYLSTILGNNYFNFIPLPSYINFFNMEKKGVDTTQMGNALFGTFKTVDYIDSSPAFLCQYVGKPSTQLSIKTPNNGYDNDAFDFNSPNSPLVTEDCGNKHLSNKVIGFSVDFGLPNQNIFESITLDQSQYQNTSESFKILQSMADSGGGGATSMASVSLYNIYASRSYTAKVTCVGNVTIQPTQYFQLRYLPMFNGPYLIINVDHEIRPNNIETTFEGIRVPRPSLPPITDLVQRVNKKLYETAEKRLGELPIDLYFDGLSSTESQKKLASIQNGYIETGTTWQTQYVLDDNVSWEDVTFSGGTFVVTPNEDPEKGHLGIDIVVASDNIEQANDPNGGILIYPTIYGTVTKVVDGCKPLQKENDCGKYGNYIEIKTLLHTNPNEGDTSYYLTRYTFLREDLSVNKGDEVLRGEVGPGTGNKILGKMGNSGLSKEIHLHLEILRGVMKEGKIVEHYLNPAQFLPRTRT